MHRNDNLPYSNDRETILYCEDGHIPRSPCAKDNINRMCCMRAITSTSLPSPQLPRASPALTGESAFVSPHPSSQSFSPSNREPHAFTCTHLHSPALLSHHHSTPSTASPLEHSS